MPADADAVLPCRARTWRGPVTNIAPTVDEKTRTVKVRIEVDNQGGALKPDMFADVAAARRTWARASSCPTAPSSTPGDRKLVFLDRPDGTPRAARGRGRRAGCPDGYQVLRGLAKGDRVVTSANFLLDSESSLKAALSALTAAGAGARAARSTEGRP